MIDFHDITVRDQRWIEPILHAANKPGADYTFTSMLFWTNYYGQVGRVGDFVTQYLHWEGRNIYLFPAGQGDLRVAVDAVLDDSLRRGGQTRFRGVTADAQAFLEEQYPGRFRFTPYRDSFDYIYTVEELTAKSCNPSATTATASNRSTRTGIPRSSRRRTLKNAGKWWPFGTKTTRRIMKFRARRRPLPRRSIILLPLAWTDGCCWTASRCSASRWAIG